MAKKDAIFDYGSNFDTSSYLIGVGKDWDNNVGSATIPRADFLWRGTPRSESYIDSVASTPAISGWDVGHCGRLDFQDIPLQDYSAYPASNEDGFPSMSHQLIYDVKKAFNLPNQETLATWKDEYTRDIDEHHFLWRTAAGHTPWPMVMSHPTKGGFRTEGDSAADEPPVDDKDLKCCLNIPIRGFSHYGGDGNEEHAIVWPTSTDIDAMNDHYKALEDASTPSADWTNPPKVGSEFNQASKLFLLNLENYYQRKPVVSPTDNLTLVISYNGHSYAEIKALIDAAVS